MLSNQLTHVKLQSKMMSSKWYWTQELLLELIDLSSQKDYSHHKKAPNNTNLHNNTWCFVFVWFFTPPPFFSFCGKKRVSKLMFHTQSPSAVMSGRSIHILSSRNRAFPLLFVTAKVVHLVAHNQSAVSLLKSRKLPYYVYKLEQSI